MRIVIETIAHQQQRSGGVGDWWDDPTMKTRRILVSDFRDPRHALLVALHELVESSLCDHRDIPEQVVQAFDEAIPDDSPYIDDPGHDPAAPYHREHVFAECLERLFAAELGVNWREYERACEALSD